jgi:hypothetical protein
VCLQRLARKSRRLLACTLQHHLSCALATHKRRPVTWHMCGGQMASDGQHAPMQRWPASSPERHGFNVSGPLTAAGTSAPACNRASFSTTAIVQPVELAAGRQGGQWRCAGAIGGDVLSSAADASGWYVRDMAADLGRVMLQDDQCICTQPTGAARIDCKQQRQACILLRQQANHRQL